MKLIDILKESIKYNAQFDSAQKKMIEDFVAFVKKELSIKEDIEVILQNDKNGIKTTAVYNYGGGEKSTIKVYCRDRQMVDILRSIAHEMTHHMQFETGKLEEKPADVGGPIEDEANAKAGEFIKKFAQMGNEIYPKEVEDVKESELSEEEENAFIVFSDEEDKKPEKSFHQSIKDKASMFVNTKFENKEYEFNHNGLSGKFKIRGIGPKGSYLGFASSLESFDFKPNEKGVHVFVRIEELKFRGQVVPLEFYYYIARYLPPEDEEDSFRGEPVLDGIRYELSDSDLATTLKGVGGYYIDEVSFEHYGNRFGL